MAPSAAPIAGGEAAQYRAEQPLIPPGGSTGPDAPHGTVGPFGCQGTSITHSQLALTIIPRFLCMGLLSTLLFLTLYMYPVLPHSNEQLPVLNFLSLVNVQPFNLSRFPNKTSPPSRRSNAPPNLVSSANLFNMDSKFRVQTIYKSTEEN